MKFILLTLIILNFSISRVYTEETRQVDKHEHGVGELNIATEGSVIEFEFMIPGADIVGFEYIAKSDTDLASINKALQTFASYDNVFILPKNCLCQLTEKKVALKEDDDEHDEHAEENHNEFYAKYSFECGNIKAINEIEFPYFSTFSNSGELEVQFISSKGSVSFEVEAKEPSINIDGKI